jgi:hypothetical protein
MCYFGAHTTDPKSFLAKLLNLNTLFILKLVYVYIFYIEVSSLYVLCDQTA